MADGPRYEPGEYFDRFVYAIGRQIAVRLRDEYSGLEFKEIAAKVDAGNRRLGVAGEMLSQPFQSNEHEVMVLDELIGAVWDLSSSAIALLAPAQQRKIDLVREIISAQQGAPETN